MLYLEFPSLPPPSANAGFYQSQKFGDRGPGDYPYTLWPGWVGPGSAEHPQYHWPVIDVSTLACTEGRQPKNPGGAWTMCGEDLDAYVDLILPVVPT